MQFGYCRSEKILRFAQNDKLLFICLVIIRRQISLGQFWKGVIAAETLRKSVVRLLQ